MTNNIEYRSLATSLYPIDGLQDKVFRFRVLRIKEPIPNDNLKPVRLQKWATYLWRKQLRCPVYPTEKMGFPGFIIPEDSNPGTQLSIEFSDVPDMVYHVEATDQIVEIALANASGVERELASRMLERPFSGRYQALRDSYWRDEWTLFYRVTPENILNTSDTILAYRGLKFGVVILGDGNPYFAADIRTKYLGRKNLGEYKDHESQQILRNHLDLGVRLDSRSTFVRDNGSIKFSCRYAGETGQTVQDCMLVNLNQSVFDYYKEKYSWITLDPKEKAVFVKDRDGSGPSLPVPISRLIPVFTNEYEGVRNCSIRSQMTPEERSTTVQVFLRDIKAVSFGNSRMTVSSKQLVRERTVFIPPNLEFGQNTIITPFAQSTLPEISTREFDSGITRWSSQKLPALYEAGPFHNETIPEVVLLYPSDFNRPNRERFISNLIQEIKQQTGQNVSVIQQQKYAVGTSERRGSSLLRQALEIKTQRPRSLTVVILWRGLFDSVHSELKKAISPAMSQCLSERTAYSISELADNRAVSQLRNLSLAILIESGLKPWVIADSLKYDLYIGIDTLYDQVCYHFLYGKGGRLIIREFGQTIARGKWKVAITRSELKARLEATISSITQTGHQIRNLVIHRDGRWWASESLALHEAIQDLTTLGVLAADVSYAAIEIRKNHLPVRLFTSVTSRDRTFLQNPLPGTYFVMDKNRAILTTTGRPGSWDRKGISAGSILLEIAEVKGNIEIESIAQDAYWLTHLNWNAPDIEISVPVTIRWNDEALRETLQSAIDDEADESSDTSVLSEDGGY